MNELSKNRREKSLRKPTAKQVSEVQSARTIGGDIFQRNMTKELNRFGVGKTSLIIPHMVFDHKLGKHKPAPSGKKSVYDFHDEVNNIVYEMCQSASDGKAAKIEGDVTSARIYNPDIKYVAVVEVERNSEKYRTNRSSYNLIEDVCDVVCYGEDEFRDYLANTYTPKNYNEGKLVDINIDDIDMLEINRDINDKWVDTLVQEILRLGFTTNIVVVPYETKEGNRRYKIIDGNHRFTAKKKLMSMGIFPIGKDGKLNRNKIQVLELDWINGNNTKLVHQICIQMNMTNKTWDVIDYIESFLKYYKMEGMREQEKDYQLLMEAYYKYDKSMTALYLIVNESLRNYADGMGKVKVGKWVCDKYKYNHITLPILDLYSDITLDPVTFGNYTKSALQWLLTFIKLEMINRIDDFSYTKLFDYFQKTLKEGAYKQYRDVNDIRDRLIPKLEAEFEVLFPIGVKEDPSEPYKYKTARKTIHHFVD